MTGMRFAPRGFGGHRRSPDQVKRDGWREQGLLAVSVDHERLSWPERELVRQLGERLYGTRGRRRPMGEWTRAQSRTGWRTPPRWCARCPA